MRRALAHLAEVARRADDAFAEVVLPDPVDHHARGQRVVRRRPATRRSRGGASSTCASGGGAGNVALAVAGDRQHARRHLRSLGVEAAAMQEERRPRLAAALADRQRGRRTACGFCLSSAAICALSSRVLRLLLGGISAHDVLLGDLGAQRVVLQRLLDLRDVQLLPFGALRRRRLARRSACTRAASRSPRSTSCFRYGASMLLLRLPQRPAAASSMRCGLRALCASTSCAGTSGCRPPRVEKNTDWMR